MHNFIYSLWKRYNEDNANNEDNNQHQRQITNSPSTYLLVTGHKNGNIRFWDTESGRLVTTLTSHKAQINALVFSPTPSLQSQNYETEQSLLRLISVANDLALKVWNIHISIST